jgi:hypothetical protein
MPIIHMLPYEKEGSIKDLVFTILVYESPLKIIQITNIIKKQYGRSVTFQGVRKAITELVTAKIIVQSDKSFSINKDWVSQNKTNADSLYDLVYNKSNKFNGTQEVTTLYFNSLNELMKFWQNFIMDWISKFNSGDDNINCYQGAHGWEGLLHLDTEKQMMMTLKQKGIKSYILSMGASQLDQQIWKFYKNIGVKTFFLPPQSSFDKSYYVGTYGEWILQAIYPDDLVKSLDKFFQNNNSLDKLDLKKLSDIVHTPREMKLTILKNKQIAQQINKSIISSLN